LKINQSYTRLHGQPTIKTIFECSKLWSYLVKWRIRFKNYFEFKTVALYLSVTAIYWQK